MYGAGDAVDACFGLIVHFVVNNGQPEDERERTSD